MFKSLCRLLSVVLCMQCVSFAAQAHDSWISRGGYRGPLNGEWCCGHDDCVTVPAQSIKQNGVGYELQNTSEVVPYQETLPSIDGQYWRCHRPDGSRRCFFAPALGF